MAINLIVFNMALQTLIFRKGFCIYLLLQAITLVLSQIYIFIDLDFIDAPTFFITFLVFVILIAIPSMVLVFKMIHNLETQLKIEALKTYQDLKTSHHIKEQYLNVYRSLDEGLMTIKDNVINFMNQIAEDILMGLNLWNDNRLIGIEELKHKIMDIKIFRIYKLDERMQQRHRSLFQSLRIGSWIHNGHRLSSKGLTNEMYQVGQTFSLRQILSKHESFLSDKIFEIVNDQERNTGPRQKDQNILKQFRYVQLKINKTKQVNLVRDMKDDSMAPEENMFFVQIIDMSLNKIFDQFETEKVFMSMLTKSTINRLKTPLLKMSEASKNMSDCQIDLHALYLYLKSHLNSEKSGFAN